MNDLKERVISVICQVASSSRQELLAVNRFTNLSQWDSLNHLNVLVALEREFNVQFGLEEATELTSLDNALRLVASKIGLIEPTSPGS